MKPDNKPSAQDKTLMSLIPDYEVHTYFSNNRSEQEFKTEIVDAWTRHSGSVMVNGKIIHKTLNDGELTFPENPEIFIERLLAFHETSIDPAIINYVLQHANLDGFMGLFEKKILDSIDDFYGKETMGETDHTGVFYFTTENLSQVQYTEKVTITHKNETFKCKCRSLISAKASQITHQFIRYTFSKLPSEKTVTCFFLPPKVGKLSQFFSRHRHHPASPENKTSSPTLENQKANRCESLGTM